jgi:fibronectin-binding autotransporter adhesin
MAPGGHRMSMIRNNSCLSAPPNTGASVIAAVGRCRSLLLSTAVAALFCTAATVQPVCAQFYTVGAASDLTTGITTANTNSDYLPTFTLSGNVTTPSGTLVPTGTTPGDSVSGNGINIATGTFTLSLSGAGTSWNAGTFASYFDIAGSGSGGLTVSDGAQLVIPDDPAVTRSSFVSLDSGTLTVTGSGSSMTTSGIAVGRVGDVAIVLTDGGQITSGNTNIGECCGFTNAANITVLVDGAGTVWNAGYSRLVERQTASM